QQIGSGTTILTGNNTYSGGTTISAGTLAATSSSSFGTGGISLAGIGATLLLGGGRNLSNTVNINQSAFIDVNSTDSATISGALVGAASFEKDGTGTLILNHDNRPSYSGNIAYHGTLVAGTTGAFGTGTVTVLGSTLVLNDGVVYSNPTVLADDLTIVQNSGIAVVASSISPTSSHWGLN